MRELTDPLAAAREHVVLERIAGIESEANADLLGAVGVEHVQRLYARELALDARVDVQVVVDLHVVGRRAESELAAGTRELDEVRVERRRVELERLDARVLPPVEALALDTIGQRVARFRRGLAGLGHVAEVDLTLHFTVVGEAAEPHLEHRRETALLIDDDVVAALRAGH